MPQPGDCQQKTKPHSCAWRVFPSWGMDRVHFSQIRIPASGIVIQGVVQGLRRTFLNDMWMTDLRLRRSKPNVFWNKKVKELCTNCLRLSRIFFDDKDTSQKSDTELACAAIGSRLKNTEKGVSLFDRASPDKFLTVFTEMSALFLRAAALSPRLAGGATLATDVAGVHPEQSHIWSILYDILLNIAVGYIFATCLRSGPCCFIEKP